MRQLLFFVITLAMLNSCTDNSKLSYKDPDMRIIFLHHSTGKNVWNGDMKGMAEVPGLLKQYNKDHNKKYSIEEKSFPFSPYPWENYPYDYYNIWIKNAGPEPYMGQPTLEILTRDYDLIIFKHCFPFSNVLPDDSLTDINSARKTVANYKLLYDALKGKLQDFPDTKFIIWTGAALVEMATTPEEAERAREFISWMTSEWDEKGDNIYIFDFRQIETEGGLYLKPEFAASETDSHPNEILSSRAAKLFVNRIIEVIETNQ